MMKIVIVLLLLPVSLYVVGDVVCDETCTDSQVCGNDGICYERSELVTCSSFASVYDHYCKKDQACCGTDCMPIGAECCGLSGYCSSGSVCGSGGCVVEEESVKLPWWLILIIVGVCVVIAAAVIIWKFKSRQNREDHQRNRVFMEQGNPVHTSMQSTNVQGYSNDQQGHIAVIVTDPK